MNILNELTKDFQYSENMVNPDMRKVTSGPFRDVLVNRNGICYSRSGKAMSISKTGFYKSINHGSAIKPWRLCALIWHDQSPALHIDGRNTDKYLNLLSFIKVLKNYSDEYELLMGELKTDYFPLSECEVFNVSTGCLGKTNGPFKRKHPDKYEKINWSYFEEIGNKIKSDFQKFKNELSEELEENLKNVSTPNTDTVEIVEPEPKEEFEVCLSDPELGGAPSLKPKVKSISKENKMDDCSDIPECKSDISMEVQEQEVQVDNKASASIDELQELFDRRAQLKKELSKIETKIKASIFH